MRVLVPPIKCQGIKTKLVPMILRTVDRDPDGLWIEPFLGSGVVVLNVMPKRALLADTNPHLVRFYQSVKDGEVDGPITRRFLESEGEILAKHGQDHYYYVRDRFNSTGDPLDFLFLNRSCFNGVIRSTNRELSTFPSDTSLSGSHLRTLPKSSTRLADSVTLPRCWTGGSCARNIRLRFERRLTETSSTVTHHTLDGM